MDTSCLLPTPDTLKLEGLTVMSKLLPGSARATAAYCSCPLPLVKGVTLGVAVTADEDATAAVVTAVSVRRTARLPTTPPDATAGMLRLAALQDVPGSW
jgi:hypothetical protein